MLLADKRANLGIRIVRIAHAQTVGAFGKAFNEFRVDALLNKDARTGGAALAVDREDGEQGGVQRAFNIGIFKKSAPAIYRPVPWSIFSARRFS